MTKVLVLGASGMLGSAVSAELEGIEAEVFVSARPGVSIELRPGQKQIYFEAFIDALDSIANSFSDSDFIINCIGVIKPYIKDNDESQRNNAIRINSLFPHELADLGTKTGVKTIQIATDCVYSGATGSYNEEAPFDALDVYGKTKSLGEVPSDFLQHLRVSIIGPEKGRSTSLLEWVLNQPIGATINGFEDHSWNGIPTKHFGKLARGIIENNLFSPGVQHIVPSDIVNKYELVSKIAEVFGRNDIKINKMDSGNAIDRTLSTLKMDQNTALWSAAGYSSPPSVLQLVAEIPN